MPLHLIQGQKLVIASHNQGKIVEFRQLFSFFDIEIVSAGELGLAEPFEDGLTFSANAEIKALAAAKKSGLMALSDDSGLAVDALEGDPGIYSARWAQTSQNGGKNFHAAMEKVHLALEKNKTTAPHACAFHAVLCLAAPDGQTTNFAGQVDGTFIWPVRGNAGFGYDPCFLPNGHTRTFGEMSSEEKHSWAPDGHGLSHRARAFDLFAKSCLGNMLEDN